MLFLGRELLTCFGLALSSPLTSGPELDASPLDKRFRTHRLEHVVSRTERSTGVNSPILPTKPFTIEKMCTGEVRGDVSSLEMLNSPLIQVFGRRIGGKQRFGPGEKSECPWRPAHGRPFFEPSQSFLCGGAVSASHTSFNHLG